MFVLYLSHTHCVHDLFKHMQTAYVTNLIAKQVTSTSWEFAIGHIHSLSIPEFYFDWNSLPQSFYIWFPSSDRVILIFVGLRIWESNHFIFYQKHNFTDRSTKQLWLFNESTVCNSTLRTAPFESSSIFNSCYWPFVSAKVFLQEHYVTNIKASFSFIPFLSNLKALKKFISSTWPKFPSDMLNLSPSASWVQVWSIKVTKRWYNGIGFLCE